MLMVQYRDEVHGVVTTTSSPKASRRALVEDPTPAVDVISDTVSDESVSDQESEWMDQSV